jgi:4'-phosphopantetheinyl transferase
MRHLADVPADAISGAWVEPAGRPALDADAVHVWRIALAVPDAEQAERAAVLARDEVARAARFHFERDRRRWTAARGAVRAVLAGYAGVPAASLAFRVGPHGKPALDGPAARAGLDFNVSHSGDLALCAVTHERAVGVDVEAIRPDFATGEVARRFFAPAEVAALEALPPAERVEAFFACWTRKEAYIKARGTGIALGLDRFEVSLAPGRPVALLATQDGPVAAARWRLGALAPGEGYAGALVTDGPARLACWQWPPAEAWPGTEAKAGLRGAQTGPDRG